MGRQRSTLRFAISIFRPRRPCLAACLAEKVFRRFRGAHDWRSADFEHRRNLVRITASNLAALKTCFACSSVDTIEGSHLQSRTENNKGRRTFSPNNSCDMLSPTIRYRRISSLRLIPTRKLSWLRALARLHSTELGLVSPAAFIPLAEETGLITEVFEAVSTSAIKAISKWQESGLTLNLAINVSVASLSDLSLPDRLRDRVRESGLVPEQVIVEITESLFMNEDPQSLEVLCRLSLMGFKVSIDDLNCYSSMSKRRAFHSVS